MTEVFILLIGFAALGAVLHIVTQGLTKRVAKLEEIVRGLQNQEAALRAQLTNVKREGLNEIRRLDQCIGTLQDETATRVRTDNVCLDFERVPLHRLYRELLEHLGLVAKHEMERVTFVKKEKPRG